MLSLLKYMGGYLRVRLSGYAPERFLNLCCNHNILIWNLKKCGGDYSFCISVRAFRRIKPFLNKTHTRVCIQEKTGFPFWMHRYRKRKLFFAGIVISLFLIWLMSQFIWNIQVRGNSAVTDETVILFLAKEESTFGSWKNRIDCEQLERDLRKEFPDIIWASAQIKGTELTIDMKENLVQNQTAPELDYEASDIIADKAAVIESIVTRRGTPLVKSQDTVEAGTVLVSGRVEIMNDNAEVSAYQYCNADADVYLVAEYPYEDTIDVLYQAKVLTGKEKNQYALELFGKNIDLSFGKIKYPCYELTTDYKQWRLNEHFYLPAVLYCNHYSEYERKEQKHSKKELEALSQENLKTYLKQLEEKDIQILEKNVMIDINEKNCRASGTITVREKAAIRQETEQLALPAEDEEGTDEPE